MRISSAIAVFSFLYLKKIKISKIYVGFGKFQKYTPVALWGATGLKCNFFLQICNEVSGEKKRGGACRPPQRATGPCRPPQGRQAPVARWGGDRVPNANWNNCFRSFLFFENSLQ